MVIPVDLSGELPDEPTDSELLEAAKAYLKQNLLDKIPSSIDIFFIHMWQTEEYASVAPLQRLRLCDTVSVSHELLGISYKAKVVAVTYDVLLERYEKMTIGETRSSLSEGMTCVRAEHKHSQDNVSAKKDAFMRLHLPPTWIWTRTTLPRVLPGLTLWL